MRIKMGNSLIGHCPSTFFFQQWLSFCSYRLDGYCATVLATALEHHYAIDECVKCVILANTYILTRVVLCAALANDDVACLHCFTAKVLQTESFRV